MRGAVNLLAVHSMTLRNNWLTYERQLILLSVDLRLISGHSPKMAEITLVTDQHYHDVLIGMIAQFLQPALDILISHVFSWKKSNNQTKGTSYIEKRTLKIQYTRIVAAFNSSLAATLMNSCNHNSRLPKIHRSVLHHAPIS